MNVNDFNKYNYNNLFSFEALNNNNVKNENDATLKAAEEAGVEKDTLGGISQLVNEVANNEMPLVELIKRLAELGGYNFTVETDDNSVDVKCEICGKGYSIHTNNKDIEVAKMINLDVQKQNVSIDKLLGL